MHITNITIEVTKGILFIYDDENWAVLQNDILWLRSMKYCLCLHVQTQTAA